MEWVITENQIAFLSVLLTGAGALANVIISFLRKRRELYNTKAATLYNEKITAYSELAGWFARLPRAEGVNLSLDDAAKLSKLCMRVLLLAGDKNINLKKFCEASNLYFNCSLNIKKEQSTGIISETSALNSTLVTMRNATQDVFRELYEDSRP